MERIYIDVTQLFECRHIHVLIRYAPIAKIDRDMPRRNTRNRRTSIREYHTYNRDADQEPMFFDDQDRHKFLSIVQRYLALEIHTDSRGRPYRNLRGHVRLLAFAVMTTHFHLVLRQLRAGGLDTFMNRVMSTYVRYFNRKYELTGPMCEDRFRSAIKLDRRSQLNAIAYVHDNHGADCHCDFCSHRYYANGAADVPSWLDAGFGLEKFGNVERYEAYREMRRGISIIAE